MRKDDPASHKRWTPILTGQNRAQALAAIREILADLPNPSIPDAFECSNRAVLLAEARYLPEMRISPGAVGLWLSRAVRRASDEAGSLDLHGGTVGVALAVECLRSRPEEKFVGSSDLDRALLRLLSDPLPVETQFDLIQGIVGLGVYLLARLPRRTARRALECLVVRLEERAEPCRDGVAWRTPPRSEPLLRRVALPGEILDVGVAHGVAGVVGFLAQAHARGILRYRTGALLRGGTRWLLSQRLSRRVPAFPTYVSGDEPHPSRAAWCYGDPGVAIALFHAAGELHDRETAREALTIARRSMALSPRDAGVEDACICHGSAGLGHLSNRLFQWTGDETFRESAIRWLTHALRGRRIGRGAAGFLFFSKRGAKRAEADRSLLNGTMGVAGALLSACANVAPVWDRPLLLDFPQLKVLA